MQSIRFKHNIQTFIPISFVMLMAAVIAVVIYTTQDIIKPVLLKERKHNIEETGREVVTKISTMLAQAEIVALNIGYTAVNLSPDFEAIKRQVPGIFDVDILRQITAGGGIWPEPFKFDPKKERLSFFWGRNRQGQLVFYDDYNRYGYHDKEWYVPVRFLKKGKVYWSRAYIDPYSHEPMVTCSASMRKRGEFLGTATVDLRLAGLKKLFVQAAREIKGYIFAVDRNNSFIVFPKEEYVLNKVKCDGRGQACTEFVTSMELARLHPVFQPVNQVLEEINREILKNARQKAPIEKMAKRLMALSSDIAPWEARLIAALLQTPVNESLATEESPRSFKVQRDFLFNRPALVYAFVMPETNWKLVVTVPEEVITAPVGRIANHLMLSLSGLILLVILLAGLFLYHYILRPLKHLTNQLKKIQKDSGDLSLELDIPVNNELGELAYYFNRRTKELRNSEEKYRTIFNGVGEGISLSSIEGQFITVNPRFAEIFGYQSPEELIQSIATYDLYVDLEDRKEILDRLQAGPSNVHSEVWLKKKDGSHVLISVNLAPVTDRNGKIKYLIAMVQDITRTKELEKELRHAQKMEAIGTLAGGIAHDFNNILAAISGYTELAQLKASGNSQLESYLSQIELASRRAKELVQQILKFSRYSDGKKDFQDMAEAIEEVIRLLHSTLPATIEIKKHITPTGLVLADPADLYQIVMNLSTNAYQAMRDSGGVLTISLTERELDEAQAEAMGLRPGRYAVLTVEDTGCGMDEEVLGKIFEPYFTTKGKEDGTGLGLAVVHGIVNGLRGYVKAESVPGKGSCFTVYLPVSRPSASHGPPRDEGDFCIQVDGKGRKVMFVDDEEMICSIFRAVLEDVGFEVHVFGDGKSALEAFEKAPDGWDLLITDMTMPRMSGADLIKEVRSYNKKISVILCSGYNQLVTDELMSNLAVDAFLTKPVNLSIFLKEIARLFPHGREDDP